MLLSKIMLNEAESVPHLVSEKLALKYAGREMEAMLKIAEASGKRFVLTFALDNAGNKGLDDVSFYLADLWQIFRRLWSYTVQNWKEILSSEHIWDRSMTACWNRIFVALSNPILVSR